MQQQSWHEKEKLSRSSRVMCRIVVQLLELVNVIHVAKFSAPQTIPDGDFLNRFRRKKMYIDVRIEIVHQHSSNGQIHVRIWVYVDLCVFIVGCVVCPCVCVCVARGWNCVCFAVCVLQLLTRERPSNLRSPFRRTGQNLDFLLDVSVLISHVLGSLLEEDMDPCYFLTPHCETSTNPHTHVSRTVVHHDEIDSGLVREKRKNRRNHQGSCPSSSH